MYAVVRWCFVSNKVITIPSAGSLNLRLGVSLSFSRPTGHRHEHGCIRGRSSHHGRIAQVLDPAAVAEVVLQLLLDVNRGGGPTLERNRGAIHGQIGEG